MPAPKKESQPIVGSLLAMVVLGALAFWGFGTLATRRIGEPLERAGPPAAPSPRAGADPVATLRAGTRHAVELAIGGFETLHRSHAVVALDAARRAARIGRDADAPGFAGLLDAIDRVRHVVQNGKVEEAPAMLNAALRTFEGAEPTGRTATAAQPIDAWAKYRGAQVINAEGVRIGEVDATEPQIVIALGKGRDWFGFVDVGGERVQVPRDRLIVSNTRGRGPMTVVLPVFGAKPAAIRAELAPGGAQP